MSLARWGFGLFPLRVRRYTKADTEIFAGLATTHVDVATATWAILELLYEETSAFIVEYSFEAHLLEHFCFYTT